MSVFQYSGGRESRLVGALEDQIYTRTKKNVNGVIEHKLSNGVIMGY